MRINALSANALTLPPVPSEELKVVAGRQQVVRQHGIFLGEFSGKRRTLYVQLDGQIILADECKCCVDWDYGEGVGFSVRRVMDCPIDDHKVIALRQQQET